MEEVSGSKGRVCVTGASGYVASWLVKRLLQSGYHVIGTVRDPGSITPFLLLHHQLMSNNRFAGGHKKLAHLWELEGAKDRLQLVKANLMDEGSFDDAVMGCEGVFHTASPVVIAMYPKQAEILDPAVTGTLNVLRSCKKNPALRRVVLTSSSSAIRVRENVNPRLPLDETSWSSVELCQTFQMWYALAKVLAEKAAWEFAKENKIDLVTLLPSFIGPSLPHDLCLTVSDVLGLLRGEKDRFSAYGRMGYVHIDDVACCHILVYENDNAQGRYLCSSNVLDNHEVAALLANRYPSLPIPNRFHNYHAEIPRYQFDTSKLRDLGFKFKGTEEMFDDCIASLRTQGYQI